MTSVDQRARVAVDLGAQSCRVSLLRWVDGEPAIEVVHRFQNEPLKIENTLRWDIDAIFAGVVEGLRKCARLASEGIASIAVDGWAVDYARLNADGSLAAAPFCYRDRRTEVAEAEVHRILSPEKLYEWTGIQILRINTLYQLYADKLAGCDPELPWLNLPEYISYRLSGRRVSEYTNATHTGLVQLNTRNWCGEIFRSLQLNQQAPPSIVPCGTILGSLKHELARSPQFENTKVIAAACHDTASAVAGIPATGDDWAFISSGTWSLVGMTLNSPCVSVQARAHNFTNLGGAGGRFCFLKNVNGLWLLRQCMDEWEGHGIRWTLDTLLHECAFLPAPSKTINVDAPELMAPGDAIAKINRQLTQLGEKRLERGRTESIALANLIFHSMAARYAEVLGSLQTITGRVLKRVFVVGGGSRNALLNRITAERTGLAVVRGSPESTTIGNFAIQLAASEEQNAAQRGVDEAAVARWAGRLADCLADGAADLETN
jgi:rhamnulokinase